MCVLSTKTDIILIQCIKVGCCFQGIPKHPNGDHQKCLSKKMCCAQCHVQRVMLSDVCCVTWSASRMCGHHWQIHSINMSYVNWCNPFNILQSAFVTPRTPPPPPPPVTPPPPPPPVTPVYLVTWLTSFTVILLDRAGCSQACIWKRWTSNYSAFLKLLTIL